MADLTYLELFAGVGGMSLGFDRAGFRCVGHCEIEPFPRRVLKHHWPDVPLFGDVRDLRGDMVESPTIVTFGAPCQDLSVAGKRAGLDGARSSLFYEGIRLWDETSAPYALYENVLGALSSNKGRDFGRVLSAFVGSPVNVPADGWRGGGGVVSGRTGVAAWRVLDAQFFGVPQRRRRVFVLGARAGGVDLAEVLSLAESLSGDSQAGREAREGTATATGSRAEGGIATFQNTGQGWWNATPVAQALRDGAAGSGPKEANIAVAFHATQTPISGSEAPSLGASAQIGVVGYEWHNQDSRIRETSVAASLSLNAEGREGNLVQAVWWNGGQVADTLGTNTDGQRMPDKGRLQAVVAPTINTTMFAKHCGSNQNVNELATLLPALGRPRRLTPLECERLMGWPDNWCNVPDDKGKPASDSSRYKACGNGVATPVAHWIALRLRMAIEGVR